MSDPAPAVRAGEAEAAVRSGRRDPPASWGAAALRLDVLSTAPPRGARQVPPGSAEHDPGRLRSGLRGRPASNDPWRRRVRGGTAAQFADPGHDVAEAGPVGCRAEFVVACAVPAEREQGLLPLASIAGQPSAVPPRLERAKR
ncbi:hypothetical protein G3I59_18885 [Amycolatopsis rubida]|uniref:Uncharacterized protein n=2 Tax=Amycolatopsis TaxID=1813 RepID=A0ABX0BQG8_9PSEU|nr:hypothetical protein [Amycolatopsis rubida]MYW92616.1 hypothetical protein [Amycolatopsis rubida]NEC57601.1 hypothetical protein [Amycolatopsis rubida]